MSRLTATLVLLLGCAPLAHATTRADCERQYAPQRGQEGKDVIWVPTGDEVVAQMLDLAQVTSADKVYDLGAGDGKIPIAAAQRFGAAAVGIEYDAGLVQYAQCMVEAEELKHRVSIVQGDIFEADFSDATVVTLYLLPELNLRLRPALLDLNPGTRVVSYSFTIGDWPADDYAETSEGLVYLWVVPAKVDGEWSFAAPSGEPGFDVTFRQTFQSVDGLASHAPLTGKLRGREIEFAYVQGGAQALFRGAVHDNRISGTVTRDGRRVEYVGTRH